MFYIESDQSCLTQMCRWWTGKIQPLPHWLTQKPRAWSVKWQGSAELCAVQVSMALIKILSTELRLLTDPMGYFLIAPGPSTRTKMNSAYSLTALPGTIMPSVWEYFTRSLQSISGFLFLPMTVFNKYWMQYWGPLSLTQDSVLPLCKFHFLSLNSPCAVVAHRPQQRAW